MRSMSPALLCLVLMTASARAENASARAAHEWRVAHEEAILGEFVNLLSIPNVARDAVKIRKKAEALVQALGKRGAEGYLLRALRGAAAGPEGMGHTAVAAGDARWTDLGAVGVR